MALLTKVEAKLAEASNLVRSRRSTAKAREAGMALAVRYPREVLNYQAMDGAIPRNLEPFFDDMVRAAEKEIRAHEKGL